MRLAPIAFAATSLVLAATSLASAEPTPSTTPVALPAKTVDADRLARALLEKKVSDLEARLARIEGKTEDLERFATEKAAALLETQLRLEMVTKALSAATAANAHVAAALDALIIEYRGHTHHYAKTKVDFVNASCEDCSSNDGHFGGMVSYIWGLSATTMTTDAPAAAK